MTIRVLIADDQELVRSGFRLILERQPEIEVVGEASDGLEVIAAAAKLRPDVVLMDIRMPNLDGIEATRRLHESLREPVPRVLILTTFDLDEYVYEALRAGASGFLLKDASVEDLVAALRVVAAGGALLAPSVTRRLIERFAQQPPHSGSAPVELIESLTARELEVLRLVARGHPNATIAETLTISEPTVKTHVGHLLAKLGAQNRAQAVVAAYEGGIIRPGDAD